MSNHLLFSNKGLILTSRKIERNNGLSKPASTPFKSVLVGVNVFFKSFKLSRLLSSSAEQKCIKTGFPLVERIKLTTGAIS